MDLERRFYLLAGLAAWQPAGTPLGGGVSAFTRSFGRRTGSTVVSSEHALPEKRVADGQEDEEVKPRLRLDDAAARARNIKRA